MYDDLDDSGEVWNFDPYIQKNDDVSQCNNNNRAAVGATKAFFSMGSGGWGGSPTMFPVAGCSSKSSKARFHAR